MAANSADGMSWSSIARHWRLAGRRVQHGCNQGCVPAKRRQRPEMLGGETAAFAGQLTQTFGMHAFGAGRVKTDSA
jgi:hypothetical protein